MLNSAGVPQQGGGRRGSKADHRKARRRLCSRIRPRPAGQYTAADLERIRSQFHRAWNGRPCSRALKEGQADTDVYIKIVDGKNARHVRIRRGIERSWTWCTSQKNFDPAELSKLDGNFESRALLQWPRRPANDISLRFSTLLLVGATLY